MAIVSSGAVSLSDIATEFGGSAPHSISEYYSGGSNVPAGVQNASNVTIPTSGQISLASSFYGSVAEVVLLETTITAGTRTRDAKLGIIEDGFSDGTGTGGVSYGSIANNSISSASRTVKGCFQIGTGLTFTISSYSYTGWTKLVLTRGSTVGIFTRADSRNTHTNEHSGQNVYSGAVRDADDNAVDVFTNGQTTNFKLIQ